MGNIWRKPKTKQNKERTRCEQGSYARGKHKFGIILRLGEIEKACFHTVGKYD
jgi:hypothetical protein